VKVKRPECPIDPADWQRKMNLRLRAEFIAGAEEDSHRRLGRGLTKEELEGVLRRYPGDALLLTRRSRTCQGAAAASTRRGSGHDSSWQPWKSET
jgi:hypothetical protein